MTPPPPKSQSSKKQNQSTIDSPVSAHLADKIDHTLLKPEATEQDLITHCEQAKRYNFATVCVLRHFVKKAAELLLGTNVKVITVVGFPTGLESTSEKVHQTRDAVSSGAKEIDMVININELKSFNYEYVYKDIQAIVQASTPYPVKVILETGALSKEQIIVGCSLSKAAGAAFVKTSTGFGPGGATAEDITLMRKTVGPNMGVKASGGVRTQADALKMLEAGATRLGTSASVAIVTGTVSEPSTALNANAVENSEAKDKDRY